MAFLDKYYRPWSLFWIIQRFILVAKQGSFSQISFKTLLTDYKSTRNVRKSLKKRASDNKSADNLKNDSATISFLSAHDGAGRIVTCPDLDQDSLSFLNKYFDHVYVVNMARRADRREKMILKLTKLKIRAEFFPAEDGNSEDNLREFSDYFNTPIDPENANEIEIKLKRKAIFSPGEWGTLKSYRNIFKDAGERGFDKILCLEDDTIFAKDFELLFNQAGKIIPGNWKIIYLGASQHTWEEGIDLIYPAEKFDENIPVKYYLPLKTDGAFAIGVRKSVFEYLITEIDKMNCAFDSGALRSALKAFSGECFALKPNLVIADVSESDIRVGRQQSNFAKIAKWDLNLYDLNGF